MILTHEDRITEVVLGDHVFAQDMSYIANVSGGEVVLRHQASVGRMTGGTVHCKGSETCVSDHVGGKLIRYELRDGKWFVLATHAKSPTSVPTCQTVTVPAEATPGTSPTAAPERVSASKSEAPLRNEQTDDAVAKIFEGCKGTETEIAKQAARDAVDALTPCFDTFVVLARKECGYLFLEVQGEADRAIDMMTAVVELRGTDKI